MTAPLPVPPYNKRPVGAFRVPTPGALTREGNAVDADWLSRELGAIERTLAPWAQFGANFVTPLMFGGKPGGPDCSAAMRRALATGYPLDLLGLDWYCNNVEGSENDQTVYSSSGMARVFKNANGDLWLAEGRDAHFTNIGFRGDAASPVYTGNNLVITGDSPVLTGCGSRYAYARALKATGNRVQVYGSGDIWQTADTTASSYDIEIGVSGTATLYHQLIGIVSSQGATDGDGGILLTDCGSQVIVGGQFGKYTVAAGTGPSGVNAGELVGSRILGPISIGVSNGSVRGVALGTATTVTFETGTTGLWIDAAVEAAGGGAWTNNGNANNVMIRQVSSGSTVAFKYGDDASAATMTVTPTSTPMFRFPVLRTDNNYGLLLRNQADNADAGSLVASTSDNVALSSLSSGKTLVLAATTGGVVTSTINGVEKLRVNANGAYPGGTTSFITQGSGTPEGNVTAPVGSLYLRTDGGAGTSLYVKESGSGTTGWVGK